MWELGIKTCNLQEDPPNNTKESEVTIIIWQHTMQNSKSHLVFILFLFSRLRQNVIQLLFSQLPISLATNRKRLGQNAKREPASSNEGRKGAKDNKYF